MAYPYKLLLPNNCYQYSLIHHEQLHLASYVYHLIINLIVFK